MKRFPQALFRAGGIELIEGKPFTSKMVQDEAELKAARAEGFHETTDDAHDAAEAKLAEANKKTVGSAGGTGGGDDTAPTREELAQKATELGIPFKPQTANKKLAELIEAKLAEAKT